MKFCGPIEKVNLKSKTNTLLRVRKIFDFQKILRQWIFSAKKPFVRLKLDLQLTHPLTWLVTGVRRVGTGDIAPVNINFNVNINVCYSIVR